MKKGYAKSIYMPQGYAKRICETDMSKEYAKRICQKDKYAKRIWTPSDTPGWLVDISGQIEDALCYQRGYFNSINCNKYSTGWHQAEMQFLPP